MNVSPAAIYLDESNKLFQQIRLHGCDWIAGAVIVGSGNLEYKGIDPEKIGDDVDSMKKDLKAICDDTVKVAHAETLGRWQSTAIKSILEKVDAIALNALPADFTDFSRVAPSMRIP